MRFNVCLFAQFQSRYYVINALIKGPVAVTPLTPGTVGSAASLAAVYLEKSTAMLTRYSSLPHDGHHQPVKSYVYLR